MAYSFNGSSDYAYCNAVYTLMPFTLACRCYLTSTAAPAVCMSIEKSGSYHKIGYAGAGKAHAASYDGSNYGVATTVRGFTTNNWHSLVGVFNSTTDRDVYFNAVTVNNTTFVKPSLIGGIDYFGSFNGVAAYWPGNLCEFAMWKVALNQNNVSTLNKGFCPLFVRPEQLVFYAPLIRDKTDCIGGVQLAVGGSPSVVEHTSEVQYPTSPNVHMKKLPFSWMNLNPVQREEVLSVHPY